MILIAVSLGLVVLFMAVILATSGSPTKRTATPTSSLIASPSPSSEPEEESPEEEAKEEQIKDFSQQPITKALPKVTSFWTLSYVGSKRMSPTLVVYNLRALIPVRSGQDANQVIATQKPHVEEFVRSTGQAPGTYSIQYQAQTVFSE
jgi:hypothetical protein